MGDETVLSGEGAAVIAVPEAVVTVPRFAVRAEF